MLSDALFRFRPAIVIVLSAIALVCAIVLVSGRIDDDPRPLVVEVDGNVAGDLRVYISGAVKNPGVYPMNPDARWIDAIDVAGGPAEDADLERVNLAQRVQDEAQIVVPRIGGSTQEVAAASGATGAAIELVNLNTADMDTLDTLPGIGEVRAERIIMSREADGPFAQVEDLVLRELIPGSVFQDISPLVTVN